MESSETLEQDLFNREFEDAERFSQSDVTSTRDFSSDSLSNQSSGTESLSERKVGRKVEDDTLILSGFHSFICSHATRPPRREHLRIQFYRGLLTCLSNLNSDSPQTSRINKRFGEEEYEYQRTLGTLKDWYWRNKEEIDEVVAAFPSPKEATPPFSSYSTSFFRAVLSHTALCSCFRLYSLFLFSDLYPQTLENRLKIACCLSNEHTPDCYSKWERLKEYYVSGLFSSAVTER